MSQTRQQNGSRPGRRLSCLEDQTEVQDRKRLRRHQRRKMVFWASFMVPQKLLPAPWLKDLLLQQALTGDSIIIRVVQDGAMRLKKQAIGTTREIFQHLRTKGFGRMTHLREIYPLTTKPTRTILLFLHDPNPGVA